MSRILVGTCNWSDHERFYPPAVKDNQRLGYYAQFFPIVEIDSTYYRLMPTRNFQLWADRTPASFVFDVKAYRTLTKHGASYEPGKRHEDRDPALDPSDDDFRRFKESIQPLRDAGKLRAVLFQFPPWFRNVPENQEYLETCREYFPDDLLAVEFRHRSWLTPEAAPDTLEALRRLGLVFVAVDQPQVGSGSVPPVAEVTNPALSIVRFHGRNAKTWYLKDAASTGERFNYLYSDDELADWKPAIERLAGEANEVHVLFNNNRANYAVLNGRDMMRLLGQPVLPLSLEGDRPADEPSQPGLGL